MKKRVKFVWLLQHKVVKDRLKRDLQKALVYDKGAPITLIVDSSPFSPRWALGQDDEQGNRYASRFGAKVSSECQKKYP